MDDIHKNLLQRLSKDDKTLEAIQEHLMRLLDSDSYNLSLNNEDLGAMVRAIEVAKQLVTEGLKDIKKLNVISRSEQQDKNPGR